MKDSTWTVICQMNDELQKHISHHFKLLLTGLEFLTQKQKRLYFLCLKLRNLRKSIYLYLQMPSMYPYNSQLGHPIIMKINSSNHIPREKPSDTIQKQDRNQNCNVTFSHSSEELGVLLPNNKRFSTSY